MKDTSFLKNQGMQVQGKLIYFNKPLTMGILNITTDSFYAESRVNDTQAICRKASDMVSAGADILDIGAYSTRPGADDISEAEELKKLTEAIAAVRMTLPSIIISADTFRANVARAAIAAGADLINDVGCGILDDKMFETVAELNVPYILMHNRAMPQEMSKATDYDDLVNDICKELSGQINKLRTLGVKDIIIDPGFGFSKTVEQNFELLRRLDELNMFGLPVLAGLSRKKMVYQTLGTTPQEALNGSTALHAICLEKGAKILRVHDVKEAREVILLWERLNGKM